MARNRNDLTPKQQKFIEEYLVDLNATRAAMRAGYSERTAYRTGADNLMKPQIMAAIKAAQAACSERTEAKADDVIRELVRLAYSDLGQVMDFTGDQPKLRAPKDITENARRSIASIKVRRVVEGKGEDAHTVEVVEFKLWDKVAALDKLARHLGLLGDTLALSGGMQLQIVESIVDAPGGNAGNKTEPRAEGVPGQ